MSRPKEAKARIKINQLLEKSGWRFFDGENGKANIQLEPNIKITQQDIDSQGDDFEKTKNGYVDYLLLGEDGFHLAVLEAKKGGKNPLDGKEQARRYAHELNVRFVILSNGNLHYFWDLEMGNPEIITEFPRQESLKGRKNFNPSPQSLSEENIDEDYIAITQRPDIVGNPHWSAKKQSLSEQHDMRVLRPYQVKAIKTLQKMAKEGKQRFLFEMATGAGKTLLSAAIIKLFLRTGNARRVLFLVDRLELEKQAHTNFVRYLKNDYTAIIYKQSRDDWNKAEIVVSTIQSLLTGGKYKKHFYHRNFEKKFFSEKTNLVFCKSFLEKALRDPITGEIGKRLIFCVSQKHSSKITQILNQMAHKLWPGKYNSDFAIQVTSNIDNSKESPTRFSSNRLNGYTRFLEGYKSSRSRVCVTVGMMTTGYDCQDILNLCLMRPIFSPSDFVQMKGRGTRKFTFKHKDENSQERKIEKEKFKLFDYFANCEYFEEKFNYDEALNLPQVQGKEGSDGQDPAVTIDEIEVFDPDKIKTISETQVGLDGMRVDREFWGKARDEILKNESIKQAVKEERWEKAERIVMEQYENKPELYLNLEKIRKSENLDRRITWRDFLERVFGLTDRFSTKDELLDEECDKFISICKPESEYIPYIRNYLRACIIDKDFRDIIDNKEYSSLYHSTTFTMEEFQALNGNTPWREKVPEYVKNYVKLNTFMD